MQISLCQTPLHLFLTYFIFLKIHRDCKLLIFYVSESPPPLTLIENIKKNKNIKFHLLRGSNSLSFRFQKLLTRILNISEIKKEICSIEISKLLIFHDSTPESQYLMNVVTLKGGKVILGEDGVALYKIGGFLDVNWVSKWIGKLLYGYWWNPKSRVGNTLIPKEIWVTNPKMVREEVFRSDVCIIDEIKIDDYKFKFNDTFIEEIENTTDIVYVVPLLSQKTPDLIGVTMENLIKLNKMVFLKFHPRESKINTDIFLRKFNSNHFNILPQEYPLEYFCLMIPSISNVVGFRSSSLHMIKKLFPKIRVEYVEDDFDYEQYNNWVSFFEGAKIQRHKINEE